MQPTQSHHTSLDKVLYLIFSHAHPFARVGNLSHARLERNGSLSVNHGIHHKPIHYVPRNSSAGEFPHVHIELRVQSFHHPGTLCIQPGCFRVPPQSTQFTSFVHFHPALNASMQYDPQQDLSLTVSICPSGHFFVMS